MKLSVFFWLGLNRTRPKGPHRKGRIETRESLSNVIRSSLVRKDLIAKGELKPRARCRRCYRRSPKGPHRKGRIETAPPKASRSWSPSPKGPHRKGRLETPEDAYPVELVHVRKDLIAKGELKPRHAYQEIRVAPRPKGPHRKGRIETGRGLPPLRAIRSCPKGPHRKGRIETRVA